MAASTFTVRARNVNATAPNANPNRKAASGWMAWRGSGRRRVRRITWSMSRSRYILHALAEAAASVPPTRVASTSQAPGSPPAARIMGGTVVINSSTMIRGLVRAANARTVSPSERSAVAGKP